MTIYLIGWGSPDRDDYMSYEIDEDYGYFTDREKAQAFCDERDLDRHRGPYKSYLEQHAADERKRESAAAPHSNGQREKEYQVLLAAGLRKPRKPYIPVEPETFEWWVEKHMAIEAAKPSWARATEWTPRYIVADLEENES